jgi:hypothetical protein
MLEWHEAISVTTTEEVINGDSQQMVPWIAFINTGLIVTMRPRFDYHGYPGSSGGGDKTSIDIKILDYDIIRNVGLLNPDVWGGGTRTLQGYGIGREDQITRLRGR